MSAQHTDEQIDALLRAEAPAAGPGEPELDPGELQAWRTGRLTPARAAEVEAVLARSAADRAVLGDLAGPVGDDLLDRMTAAAPRGRSRTWAWVGAGLALAAGVAVAVLRSGPPAPAYTLGAVRGGVQVSRAEGPATPDGPAVFVPAGTLRLTVRPEAAPTGAAPTAAAFVSCDGGPLIAVPAERLAAGPGGAWTLTAPAASLFGEPPARCEVMIALAAEAGALSGLAGAPPGEVSGAAGVGWVRLDVDYRSAP